MHLWVRSMLVAGATHHVSRRLIFKTNLMDPVVITLASNERYFPGLYCAVASALGYLNSTREADLKC